MYIRCTDKSGFEDQLTQGKVYQILKDKNNSYFIANDKEKKVWYGKSHFEVEFF